MVIHLKTIPPSRKEPQDSIVPRKKYFNFFSYNTVDKKFACTVTHYISFSLLGLLSPGEDRFEVARIFQQRLVKDPIKTFP